MFVPVFASGPEFLAYKAMFRITKAMLDEHKWYTVVFEAMFTSRKAQETLISKIKREEDVERRENKEGKKILGVFPSDSKG